MALKGCKRSTELKDNECGGCGTTIDVVDNCCPECAKGYPDPTPEESKEALEYYRSWVEPPSNDTNKPQQILDLPTPPIATGFAILNDGSKVDIRDLPDAMDRLLK